MPLADAELGSENTMDSLGMEDLSAALDIDVTDLSAVNSVIIVHRECHGYVQAMWVVGVGALWVWVGVWTWGTHTHKYDSKLLKCCRSVVFHLHDVHQVELTRLIRNRMGK